MKTTATLLAAGSLLLATASILVPTAALGAQNDARPMAQTRSERGSEARRPAKAAHDFRRLHLPGEEVARNVERLTSELHWYRSLSSALAAGRSADKPVVWIQALGDIDGFL